MIYVRAICEADFLLYVDALTKITPWFFALDHTNYTRWVPVHLRDMVTLEMKHPEIFTVSQRKLCGEEDRLSVLCNNNRSGP